MNISDRDALFILSLVFTPGKAGIDSLVEKYESPAELLNVLLNGSDRYIPHQFTAAVKAFDMSLPDDIRSYCDGRGIGIIMRGDADYPEKFEHVDCPPMAFYCLGDSSELNKENSLTIVGARKATEYSQKIAHHFAKAAAEAGHAVISGFARGTDSAAHSRCSRLRYRL